MRNGSADLSPSWLFLSRTPRLVPNVGCQNLGIRPVLSQTCGSVPIAAGPSTRCAPNNGSTLAVARGEGTVQVRFRTIVALTSSWYPFFGVESVVWRHGQWKVRMLNRCRYHAFLMTARCSLGMQLPHSTHPALPSLTAHPPLIRRAGCVHCARRCMLFSTL